MVKLKNFRAACDINLGSSVMITGGYYTSKTVTEYGENGYMRDAPELQVGRRNHGCSYYVNSDGTKVDDEILITLLCKYFRLYWSLVAGWLVITTPQPRCWWVLLHPGSLLETFQLLVNISVGTILITRY